MEENEGVAGSHRNDAGPHVRVVQISNQVRVCRPNKLHAHVCQPTESAASSALGEGLPDQTHYRPTRVNQRTQMKALHTAKRTRPAPAPYQWPRGVHLSHDLQKLLQPTWRNHLHGRLMGCVAKMWRLTSHSSATQRNSRMVKCKTQPVQFMPEARTWAASVGHALTMSSKVTLAISKSGMSMSLAMIHSATSGRETNDFPSNVEQRPLTGGKQTMGMSTPAGTIDVVHYNVESRPMTCSKHTQAVKHDLADRMAACSWFMSGSCV